MQVRIAPPQGHDTPPVLRGSDNGPPRPVLPAQMSQACGVVDVRDRCVDDPAVELASAANGSQGLIAFVCNAKGESGSDVGPGPRWNEIEVIGDFRGFKLIVKT